MKKQVEKLLSGHEIDLSEKSIREVIEVLNNKNFEPILFAKYPLSPLPEGEIIFKNKNWNLDNKKWI